MRYDAIVIGAGVNGLTTAAYLGKAGRRVVVVEQREDVGGLCVTREFFPGFRANTCVDDPGWMPPAVMRDLALAGHGYAPRPASCGAVFPLAGGDPVPLWGDPRRAAAALAAHSPADAGRWPDFVQQVHRLAGMLERVSSMRTPDIGGRGPGELLPLLALGRRLRGLGRRGMVDFLRAVPMPVADYLDEWFDSAALKGALSVSGVRNVQHGPMSGGTTLVFLHHHLGLPGGLAGGRRLVRGGVGQLPAALLGAARAAGVEVRAGAAIEAIVARDDRVAGVGLANGDVIEAPMVVSSADVRRTFDLVDPGLFDPVFLGAVDAVRMRGPAARVHLALDGLPAFSSGGSPWPAETLIGTLVIAPDIAWVERAYDAAKHGGVAESPSLELDVPTLHEPAMAPAGQHVVSVQVQFAACHMTGGWTAERRDALTEAVLRQVERHAPDLRSRLLHVETLTPDDLSREFHVTEGSLLHGELALDQFLFMRPVPACARYATPLPGLWLCGSSTHPGAGTAAASGWLASHEILKEKRR
jgi:phytoene dehydrogenase-like protein